MAAHPRRPTKPSVYLDQSTLSDAFRAGLINDRKPDRLRGYGPLAPCVERVASDADLCVSILHAQELAAWEDVAMAHGLAKWLDGLEVVWMHATEAAQAIEDDHWLAVAVGLREPSPAPVFAPSCSQRCRP
ncbi:MAG: hypothetical protein HYV09_21405 [Deltaproteobacteria bacterium]|nr:hypothetical protein [Deltaproteobacteria bacterium]